MNNRLGLVGILMVGCLAVIPMMNGCSGSDESTDGGTKADAGKTDGGKTDAGPADAGAKGGIGDRCADSSAQAQSTCQRTFSCYGLTDSNYCSKECTADADCGTNGSFDNLCLNIGIQLCLRGCDPADKTTCLRGDLACYSVDDTNQVGVCFPACTNNNDCNYGFTCDTASGVCQGENCGAGNTCTSADDVCFVRQDDNNQTQKTCVPKCSTAGCPDGRSCNATTNICDPIIHDTYGDCGAGIAECGENNVCVGFGDPGSLCLQNCAMDTDCPSGSTCAVGLNGGQKVCAVTCGTTAAPDDSVCPTGTACQWFTDDSQTTLFCGPVAQQ